MDIAHALTFELCLLQLALCSYDSTGLRVPGCLCEWNLTDLLFSCSLKALDDIDEWLKVSKKGSYTPVDNEHQYVLKHSLHLSLSVLWSFLPPTHCTSIELVETLASNTDSATFPVGSLERPEYQSNPAVQVIFWGTCKST